MTNATSREYLARFNSLISPFDSAETPELCRLVTSELAGIKNETLRTILSDLVESALTFEQEVAHV